MLIRELEKAEDSLEQTRDLEKCGFITSSEAQSIREKRKTFEHRINMRGVDVASFTDYIGHEQRVLALLKSQRMNNTPRSVGSSSHDLRKRVLFQKRVVRGVFGRALLKHKESLELWLSYISFLKTNDGPNLPSQAYGR